MKEFSNPLDLWQPRRSMSRLAISIGLTLHSLIINAISGIADKESHKLKNKENKLSHRGHLWNPKQY